MKRRNLLVDRRTLIKCREVEQARISKWVSDRLSGKCSSAFHVSGPPGTGKTFVLRTIVEQIEEDDAVYVNCMQLSGRTLADHLSDAFGVRPEKLIDRIGVRCRRKRRGCLIVIDEIDQLLPKKRTSTRKSMAKINEDEMLLVNILRMALQSKFRLALIGVSNTLIDLSGRFYAQTGLEKIKTHLRSISFAPYTRHDIDAIIALNLGDDCSNEFGNRQTLRLGSVRISNSTGDARKAVELAHKIGRICGEIKTKPSSLSTSPIMVRDENDLDQTAKQLPLSQKLVLKSLVEMVASTPGKLVVGKVDECFAYFSRNQSIIQLSRPEYDGTLACIGDLGLLTLERVVVKTKRSFGLSRSNSIRNAEVMVVKLGKHPEDLRTFLKQLEL